MHMTIPSKHDHDDDYLSMTATIMIYCSVDLCGSNVSNRLWRWIFNKLFEMICVLAQPTWPSRPFIKHFASTAKVAKCMIWHVILGILMIVNLPWFTQSWCTQLLIRHDQLGYELQREVWEGYEVPILWTSSCTQLSVLCWFCVDWRC